MSYRIVIVEDEILIARELEVRLGDLGYEVAGIASSGREALELVEQTRPDLVLMDIVLKGEMDGITAATEIRRRYSLPVIFVTAFTDAETLNRAKQAEPGGYIVKPFSMREIEANIEMALYKHRAEIKLRQMEKWFGASMAQVADGVIATTFDGGTITFMNRNAELLTGWPGDEAIGREFDDVFRVIRRDGVETAADPLSRIREEGVFVEMAKNVFLVNREQREVPVEYTGACQRDEAGETGGIVIVFRDLSFHKFNEERLRKAEIQLLHAEKVDTIGKLASAIAHDFNNLLTVILGNCNVLLNHQLDSDKSREVVRQIQEAGNRASSFTSQLLSFSRKQVIEPKLLEMNSMIIGSKKFLARLLGESVRFTLRLTPEPCTVMADQGQLEQVIMNLVLNARDALAENGEITVETRCIEFDETPSGSPPGIKPGRYVHLRIEDNGCGMTADLQEHIFEPFYTTKREGQGTGIGLSTVLDVVTNSSGYIDVDSEPGAGSLFNIYLPFTDQKAAANPDIDVTRLPLGSGAIVLLGACDSTHELSRQLLLLCGYTVVEAGDGADAVDICREGHLPIRLLVTDCAAADTDCSTLAKQVRAINSDIKLLFISSGGEDGLVNQGIHEVGGIVLQKPFTPNALAGKVEEILAD